jgi:hypothetical protein
MTIDVQEIESPSTLCRISHVFDTPNPWAEPFIVSEYHYFEKDGAIFRKSKNGAAGVDDVKTPDGWKPYQGDRLAPVHFGDRISEEEACGNL